MTQKEIASAFTDEATIIGQVEVRRWKYLPLTKKMTLSISGLPIGKVQMIASEFDEMLNGEDISHMTPSDQINRLLKCGLPSLANVVGLAVCKGSKKPSKQLLDAILDQLDMEKLALAITEIYRRLDLTTFFDILSLIKSLNLNLTPDQEARGRQS